MSTLKTYFHSAVVVLVLAFAGNITSHYCFDGIEPPVTVYFEILNDHPEHEDTGQLHSDVDQSGLPSALLTKLSDQDQPMLLSAFVFLFAFIRRPRLSPSPPDQGLPAWEAPSSLRPPLRAPPTNSR